MSIIYIIRMYQKEDAPPSFTQNAQVKSAILLCFLNDCRQRVRKVLEQSILLLDCHSQNTIEELPDVVVVWEK